MARQPWVVADGLWGVVGPLFPQEGAVFPPSRSGAASGSAGAVRDLVCVVYRDGLDAAAAGAWVRVGDHVLVSARGWQQAGVWEQLHVVLLTRLRSAGEIEWSRAIADSSQMQAEKGGAETGPSPVERGRAGSKHHLLVDGSGLPLLWALTGNTKHGSGLGRYRWAIERTSAWPHRTKRLPVRYHRRRRDPPSLPRPRQPPDLLPTPHQLILKRPLRPEPGRS